jgi:hypothetical protein
MNLPSLSQIWADGYKTLRLPKGKDWPKDRPVDFEVRSPDDELLGYASTATAVAQLVTCHQRVKARTAPIDPETLL